MNSKPTVFRITIEFLEPFRLVEWTEPANRRAERESGIDRGTFARWHKNGDGTGNPYITGTLLRSAVLLAAEELIARNGGEWNDIKCCPGIRLSDTKPTFLRKRPTFYSIYSKALCESADDACPYCLLLGSFDAAQGKNRPGERQFSAKDFHVHFSNLLPAGKDAYHRGVDDLGCKRAINRVDYTTGKAHDYVHIWEMDPDRCSTFVGTITVNHEAAEALLGDSVRMVDTLCGAMCKIVLSKDGGSISSMGEPKAQENSAGHTLSPAMAHSPFEAATYELATTIVNAFIQAHKSDRARVLADAVLSMRLRPDDTFEHLPELSEERRHRMWDVPVNGETLRKFLSKFRKEHEHEKWRTLCETLGQAIYDCYKAKTGEAVAVPPALGTPEYHAPSSDGHENRLIMVEAGDSTWEEWIFTGTLRSETPFHFGTETRPGDQRSLQILLDRNGRYRLPRSSLRGILRKEIRRAFGGNGCDTELGGSTLCECPVCRTMAHIKIMDTKSTYVEPPEIRARIRRNPFTATVLEGALFDMEVGPEGLGFPFVLRYRGASLPRELTAVLSQWSRGLAWFGGSGSTGKGRFSLDDLRCCKWNLMNEDEGLNEQGLDTFMRESGFRGNESGLFEALESGKNPFLSPVELINEVGPDTCTELADLWERVDYSISFAVPLLAADPVEALFDPEGHDSVAFRKRVLEGDEIKHHYCLKGETVRGLLRTAIGRRLETLGDDHEDCECELCSIFGNEHEAGVLRVEDLVPVDTPETIHIDNVAIDRAQGGAREKMKFDKLPLAGSPHRHLEFRGCLWFRDSQRDRILARVNQAFQDMKDGLYPLGSASGTGYGWVEDVTVNSTALARREFTPAGTTATAEEMSFPALPVISWNRDHIYYPYYFVVPHNTVSRENELTGHDRLHDDRVSGRITCTLSTLSPLIIPDTTDMDGLKLEVPEHKSFKFFRVNGHAMIPGSELRAMVSSVYETVTNSCMRVFDEDTYISWRMDPEENKEENFSARSFKPGMVKVEKGSDGEEDVYKIIKMEELRFPLYDDMTTTRAIPDNDYEKDCPSDPDKAEAIRTTNINMAEAAQENRAILLDILERDPKRFEKILSGKEPVSFKWVWALTNDKEPRSKNGHNPHSKIAILKRTSGGQSVGHIKISGLNKVEVSNKPTTTKPFDADWDIKKLNITLNSGHNSVASTKHAYPRPYLSFVRDDVEYSTTKRCERLFYEEHPNNQRGYTIPRKVLKRYNQLISDAIKERKNRQIDANFQTILPELENGALVYFHARQDAPSTVDAIIPVRISRVYDDRPLGEKLPSAYALRPCERSYLAEEDVFLKPDSALFYHHPDGLCPACRLFGTTEYKGRVRFGFAHPVGDTPTLLTTRKAQEEREYVTLPALMEPRITWAIPSRHFKVPGRKVYPHHGYWDKIIKNQDEIEQSDLNRSVEAVDHGNTFQFDVYFENLERWELGLLLYSIGLEKHANRLLAHKLGMGKPFGFGSVETEITELATVCMDASMNSSGALWKQATREIGTFIGEGFEKLHEWFGDKRNTEAHIDSLRRLLVFLRDEQTQLVAKYPVLDEDSEDPIKGQRIKGYSYKELKEKVSHELRAEKLKTPWSPFFSVSSARFFP